VADTSITLYRGAAATSDTTLYTSPSDMAVAVTNIAIVNDTSSAVTATINLATPFTRWYQSVAANSTQFIDLEQIIYNGETITGSASTTTVDFHIAGYEVY
jgi:uncharacterized protein (UPF0371 family)